MNRIYTGVLATVLVCLSTAAVALGQTERTVVKSTAVQNPDGSYTIIEYPVGKEVQVALTPVSINGFNGTATIMRDPNGTTIKLNLEGMPNELTSLNLYAVEPSGKVTSLGPMVLAKGTGVFTTTAPLSRFMIIASQETNLVTYTPESRIVFRSAVPEGYAVVPLTTQPLGEKVAAATTAGGMQESVYTVPMLNIPAYKRGDDTKLKVNFSGALAGARANIFIEPHKNGARTEVRFRFHELKEAPRGKVFTIWAVAPDNHFEKLGQIVNTHGRNEAEIKAETALSDFGLLVTMEDIGDIMKPVGSRIGVVEIIR